MKRLIRAIAVGTMLSAGLVPAPATGAESPALTQVASCVRERGRLLVLALVDESGSLRDTDPDDARVVALQAVVANLNNLARTTNQGRGVDVELQIAGFSAEFSDRTSWIGLDDHSYPLITQTIAEFAARDNGIDTDFANAMEGARTSFAQRTAEVTKDGSPEPCRFLLMFTDGDYDIEPRTTTARRRLGMTKPYAKDIQLVDEAAAARAVERGRLALCDSDGIADALRANGVVTATVALTPSISPEDQRFIRAVATGAAAGVSCGKRGGPSAGIYLPADRISDLLFVLDELVVGPAGGTKEPGPGRQRVCGPHVDPACTRQFYIDGSLRAFHVLADLGAGGLRVELRSPGSSKPLAFEFGPSSMQNLGSAEVSSGWLSDSALTLDVTLPSGKADWVGTWSVTFVDPTGNRAGAAARSQIFVYGDLFPSLVGDVVLTLGESTSFAVRVIDQKGTPKTPRGLVRTATITGTLVDPSTKAQTPVVLTGPDSAGLFHGELRVADSIESSLLDLSLRLDITTNGGLALTPTSRTYAVPVRPPAAYPTVDPAALTLGSITTGKPVRRALTVRGGTRGTGCVWLESSDFDIRPGGVKGVRVTTSPVATAAKNCLRVAAGETKELVVEVAPDGGGAGALRGTAVLRVSSEGSDRALTTRVRVSGSMYVPIDITERAAWFALLLALGLLLPVVFLYLANRWLGRFAPSDDLRYARVGVTVDSGVVRVSETRTPLHLDPLDFRTFDGSADRIRRLRSNLLGVDFRARQPRIPVSAPWGTVEAPGTYVTASLGHVAQPNGTAGRLPLSLAGAWVFQLTGYTAQPDEKPTEASGILHGLVPDTLGTDPTLAVEKVYRELPSRALALADLKVARDRESSDAESAVERDGSLPPVPDARWGHGDRPLPPPPSYGDHRRPPPAPAGAPGARRSTSVPADDPPPSPLPKPPDY